jgi:uncharacterized membrane protein YsdA (DUF1294 family)
MYGRGAASRVAAWHGARRTKETAMQTQLLIGGRLVAGEGATVVRHVMVKL